MGEHCQIRDGRRYKKGRRGKRGKEGEKDEEKRGKWLWIMLLVWGTNVGLQ